MGVRGLGVGVQVLLPCGGPEAEEDFRNFGLKVGRILDSSVFVVRRARYGRKLDFALLIFKSADLLRILFE